MGFMLPAQFRRNWWRTGHPQARQVYDFLKENARNVLSGRARLPVFGYSAAPVR